MFIQHEMQAFTWTSLGLSETETLTPRWGFGLHGFTLPVITRTGEAIYRTCISISGHDRSLIGAVGPDTLQGMGSV